VWPAYQCFKAVESQNTDHIREWAVYWLTLALFTGAERLLDMFVSWQALPILSEKPNVVQHAVHACGLLLAPIWHQPGRCGTTARRTQSCRWHAHSEVACATAVSPLPVIGESPWPII